MLAPGAMSPPARSPRDIGHDDRPQHFIRSLDEPRLREVACSLPGNGDSDVMAASHVVPPSIFRNEQMEEREQGAGFVLATS